MKVEVKRSFTNVYKYANIEGIDIDEYVLILSSLRSKKETYENMVKYKHNTDEEIIRYKTKIEMLDNMIKAFENK